VCDEMLSVTVCCLKADELAVAAIISAYRA
jgi:hypothetical protein